MKKFLAFLSLGGDHKQQVCFLMLIISVLYLFNFHVNDIWTPNESFYAEAVREKCSSREISWKSFTTTNQDITNPLTLG